jgi:putative DNA primase/helicase
VQANDGVILKLEDFAAKAAEGAQRAKGNGEGDALEQAVALALSQGATEDAVALAFAIQHRDRLRFSYRHGRWFMWDGARWREEPTSLAYEFARRLAREANAKGARAIAKSSFAAGVERFARSDRAFAMRGDEWDADPWLLGTPGGTVDLRTGNLRPARREDLICRSTAVAPEEGEPRLWRQFLAQATEGDEELELFLRQIAGYALTGDAREECLFFLYGPGGNGKGTFIGALHEALGDYAASAAMDTFLASRFERHSTDLAMLAAARLVIASETREGRAWDEQRVKALTGGDPITARFMREDNFTYRATFKLVLFGNHKPVLRNVDEAWRRRIHVVPFAYRPPTRDPTLKERLRPELGQILRWAIDGCLDWQANGLVIPPRVQAETATYFEAQDLFTSWLDEHCEADRPHVATTKDLFASWKSYAEAANEHAGSARSLADRLASAGFRRIRDTLGIRGKGFAGLRLKALP